MASIRKLLALQNVLAAVWSLVNLLVVGSLVIWGDFGLPRGLVFVAPIWGLTVGLPAMVALPFAFMGFEVLRTMTLVRSVPAFVIVFCMVSFVAHRLAAGVLLDLTGYRRAQ